MDPTNKENFDHTNPPLPPRPEKIADIGKLGGSEVKPGPVTKSGGRVPPRPKHPLPPIPKTDKPEYKKLDIVPLSLTDKPDHPIIKKKKKTDKPAADREVTFKKTVEHRLHTGKVVEGEGYVREAIDRKRLPLVDESSNSQGMTKKQMTDSQADAWVESWSKKIAEWKKKPYEERPIGYSREKDFHRGNKELSEKGLTGRGASQIHKSSSPSWVTDPKAVQRIADQAWFEMNVLEEPLTRENMLKKMLDMNEGGKEVVSAKELEELYFDVNPAEKKSEVAKNDPVTGKKVEETKKVTEQELISGLVYSTQEVNQVVNEFGLRGVKEIVKIANGQFLIKYQHVNPTEISDYVNRLEFPKEA